MLRPSLSLTLTLCLGALIPAQASDEELAKLDARLRFRLDDKGRILLSPDPSRGGQGGEVPLVDPFSTHFLANAGSMGWLTMLFWGDSDLASMADAPRILQRLGRDGDVDLFQAIAGTGDAGPLIPAYRILAIRCAQARGLKPALGPLNKVADDGTAPADLRRAAREAVAALTGVRLPRVPVRCPPLAQVLARAPVAPDLVLRVDHHRLAPAWALPRWGREVAMGFTTEAVRQAGGLLSLATWAGAVRLSEAVGAAPYALARTFGNHRPARLVLAVSDLEREDAPTLFGQVDGAFDVAALRAGLGALAEPVEGGGIEVDVGPAMLGFAPTRAVARMPGKPGKTLGAEAARALAAELDADDAPFALLLRSELPVPQRGRGRGGPGDLLAAINRYALRRLAVWPPDAGSPRVVLRATCADEAKAKALAADAEAGLAGFARRADAAADSDKDGDMIGLVATALRGMTYQRENATVTATLTLKGIDVPRALLALSRTNLLR